MEKPALKLEAETIKMSVSLQLLEGNANKPNAPAPTAPPLWFSKRLLVAILLIFCCANFQILKFNMNIAVVEMTSNKSLVNGNITFTKPPEFDWDTKTVGLVTSLVGYGGIFAFLGGFLTNALGGSVGCSLCMFLSSVTTLLHPITLYHNFNTFLVCRFLTGLCEALFYVSTTEVTVRWYPKKERSTLISFGFNGVNIGSAAVYPFCGFIAHHWGWPMVFYITGGISLIASLAFLYIVKNRPSQDSRISKKELAYILEETEVDNNVEDTKSNKSLSLNAWQIYKNILTSAPVWALLSSHFIFTWITNVLWACLPLYAKDSTQKQTDEIGYLSSIPYTVYVFIFPLAGSLLDYWSNRSTMSTTRMHKIILSIGYLAAAALFVCATFVSNFIISLILFVLILILTSFLQLILILNVIVLAPDHSSHISGLVAFPISLGGILTQTVTGFMTTNHTVQEWNNCFLLAAGFSILGAVIFVLCGSSEAQPWSSSYQPKKENRSNGKS